ncbi:MAG: N-acetylmuramoyl-L-alanine amidase [Geminicoccaceae bacterium]
MTFFIRDMPSPNVDERPEGCSVDCLILHYTGMKTADEALARLCDPAAKVSAHYVIGEDGRIVRLVDEMMRAWHAGVSSWQGRERLNDCSIGIEIVNPGHEWGYRPFTEAQYQALERLCPAIMKRWSIPSSRVLAHSDVAPDRKEDPGELFDWPRLAASGIGIWPEDGEGAPRSLDEAIQQLHAIGYSLPDPGDDRSTVCRLAAFQRRFRPERADGVLDRQTLARLDGLLAMETFS